jgi:hypothetical protein
LAFFSLSTHLIRTGNFCAQLSASSLFMDKLKMLKKAALDLHFYMKGEQINYAK